MPVTIDARWYLSVIDAMAEGVIVYDRKGTALVVNPAACRLLGLTEEQIRGRVPVRQAWQPLALDGTPLPFGELPVARVLRTGEPIENELLGLHLEDRVVWLSVSARALSSEEPGLAGVVLSFRDATHLKVGRDLDQAAREMARRLVEVPLGSADQVIDAHLATVGEASGAERALYIALDREAGRAFTTHDWPASGSTISGRDRGTPLDVLARVLGMLSRREVVTLVDRAELPSGSGVLKARLAAFGLRSAVAAPVILADSLEGALMIGWDQPAMPNAQLVAFVNTAAELLASRLERERAHDDLQQRNRALDDRVRAGLADLAREQERTRALVDAIPDLLFEVSPDGLFAMAHAPDPSMLAIPVEDFIGRTVEEILGPRRGAAIANAVTRIHRWGKPQIVNLDLRIHGLDRNYECRLSPMRDGAVLAVVRDVTGPSERNRVLREQARKLARANEELQQAVQTRDEFLASMSHELRTPLNAILGHTEMLVDTSSEPLSDRQRASIETIESSGSHLLALINDLLDLSRMNARMTSLDVGDTKVEDVCQLALDLIRHRAVKKGLRVEYINSAVRPSFRADDRRLKQVLLNLLDNAMKFTEPGGSIGLHVRNIAGTHIAFTVWDTGIGIDPADHMRVFEPFTQVERGMARRYHGSGLGLALVERLVALHDGSVELDSEPGRGSRFGVILPMAGPAARAAQVPSPDGEG